jgi:CsoR family transcriptional regulator, copper-sensing transcriptional repressor
MTKLQRIAIKMPNLVQRYFEENAPNWDQRMPPNYSAILQDFARPFAAEFQAASTILEIGTGTGAFIPVLNALAPAARLVSADFAYAMISQAQKRCPDARLLQTDVHHLPLVSAAIDLVICHNSFPHFAHKRQALGEIARVLRPGGKLLILHNNSREFVNALHGRDEASPIHHDLLPNADDMCQLLISTGWTAVEVEDSPSRYIARAQRNL